jgi:hypothetical protein
MKQPDTVVYAFRVSVVSADLSYAKSSLPVISADAVPMKLRSDAMSKSLI